MHIYIYIYIYMYIYIYIYIGMIHVARLTAVGVKFSSTGSRPLRMTCVAVLSSPVDRGG